MTERTVTRTFGAQSLVAPLRDALGKRPGPALVPARGAILLRSGKANRRGEEAAHEAWYRARGIPVIGRIEAPGTVDGGDTFWLDRATLCIGRALRTNRSGGAPMAR